jgi:cellulose synthase/poly-beta-1,6-N-acetylglucosamine synthase-like glycosyltransferase
VTAVFDSIIVIVAEFLLGAIAFGILFCTVVLFVEIIAAVIGHLAPRPEEGERRPIAVLMPAHNESAVIAAAIRSVLPQLAIHDRLVVIADNCSDDTAVIAATEGAEVLVRTDFAHRGKGYALDFGVRHLESNPPDVILIVDADCHVSPGAVDHLVRLSCRTNRPVQAIYLMQAGPAARLNMRIAEFAWLVKNKVRPVGLNRLGLPCQLTGTGMAFPWVWLSKAALATGHIVEDMKLGLELARAGAAPLLCPEALVTSNFPISGDGIKSQRTRWEHGHLGVILNDAPRLFLDGVRRRDADLLALVLDLCVPPTALLALMVVAIWTSCAILFYLSAAAWPLGIASLAALLMAASVLMSWRAYGRHIMTLGTLLLSIVYPLWKIPLYLRFLVARQVDWVRSKRD